MTNAFEIMRCLNPHALTGQEDGVDVFIEDFADPDERMYRIEYQSTSDGQHAVALCRFNPWGALNGDEDYQTGHVDSEGFICVGDQSVKSVTESPYDLRFVVQRARFWCTAFSVLKETGAFPKV